MQLRPILSTLGKHKTAAALIVLEVALSCAIVCNALFLIGTRIERIDRPSGVSEDQVLVIRVSGIGKDDNPDALTRTDLDALRALPGVKAATSANQVPFGGNSHNGSVNREQGQQRSTLNAAMYLGGRELLDTLGLQLVAGRNFNADEIINVEARRRENPPPIPSAVVTRAVADTLYPQGDALGRPLYSWGDTPIKIVGIVDHLQRPNDAGGAIGADRSVIFPLSTSYIGGGYYLLRVAADRRDDTLAAAVKVLERNTPNRIILDQETFSAMRSDYYRPDRAMAWLLLTMSVALLVVTALGIVGLASFWVQQRTRQIGIRRALGSTRGQVLRYFQTENFVLATIGIVLGMLLAYSINLWLMERYELPRLPLAYLPLGAVALWLLGQIAVLGPARRAAAVPPAVATRGS